MENRKAQSVLEYCLLIAALVAALIVMFIPLRFHIQGKIKESADTFGRGEQYQPDGPSQTQCFDAQGNLIPC